VLGFLTKQVSLALLTNVRSSIWPGLQPLYMDVFQNSKWIGGNGTSIDFWHSNWVGRSIVDKLNIQPHFLKILCGNVVDFIRNGSWFCSTILNDEMTEIWSKISAIMLHTSNMEDKFIWLSSSNGAPSIVIYDL
jgi:hypothetical protein